jgi:hypothetical protein
MEYAVQEATECRASAIRYDLLRTAAVRLCLSSFNQFTCSLPSIAAPKRSLRLSEVNVACCLCTPFSSFILPVSWKVPSSQCPLRHCAIFGRLSLPVSSPVIDPYPGEATGCPSKLSYRGETMEMNTTFHIPHPPEPHHQASAVDHLACRSRDGGGFLLWNP